MEILETKIKNLLLHKELTYIEFYNANDKFWVFDEEKIWVLDIGVQLTLGDEHFTFGWDSEKQFYEQHIGKIEEITRDQEIQHLEAENVEGIKALIGKKITDVKIQWNHYFDIDENYEPTEHKNYMPMEILITFENGSLLQLAAIRFDVDTENKTITDVTFDSEANFLVTLDHKIGIVLESVEE